MKLLASRATLFATFYCVFAISTVNCDARSGQDGNSESSAVIASQESASDVRINDIGKLLQLLLENFDQPTTGDRQVSRRHATLPVSDHDSANKFAISGDHSPFIAYQHPRATDLGKGGLNRLNRRSASEEKDNTPAPNSNTTSKPDQDSNSGPLKTILGFPSQGRNLNSFNPFDNQHLMNISNIFKNGLFGNLEIGTLPQPVKKIFGFVMDRLQSKLKSNGDKDDQQSNERFPRKLFEHGKNLLSNVKENVENLAPVGIHRTFKLGPWSVNFDMGKP